MESFVPLLQFRDNFFIQCRNELQQIGEHAARGGGGGGGGEEDSPLALIPSVLPLVMKSKISIKAI